MLRHDFKVFDRVLVRGSAGGYWRPAIFSRYDIYQKDFAPYGMLDGSWHPVCILFEGNEGLVHTCKDVDGEQENSSEEFWGSVYNNSKEMDSGSKEIFKFLEIFEKVMGNVVYILNFTEDRMRKFYSFRDVREEIRDRHESMILRVICDVGSDMSVEHMWTTIDGDNWLLAD
jgi:hypothetical protein